MQSNFQILSIILWHTVGSTCVLPYQILSFRQENPIMIGETVLGSETVAMLFNALLTPSRTTELHVKLSLHLKQLYTDCETVTCN